MDDLLRQLEDKKEIRKQLNLQKVSEQTMSKTLQKFSENRSGDQVVKSGRSRDSILRRVEDLTGENDNQRNEPVNKKQPKTSATSKAQSFMAKNLSAESTRAYSLLKVATGAKNLRGHEMEERRLGPSDSSQSEKDFLFHRGASSFDFEADSTNDMEMTGNNKDGFYTELNESLAKTWRESIQDGGDGSIAPDTSQAMTEKEIEDAINDMNAFIKEITK